MLRINHTCRIALVALCVTLLALPATPARAATFTVTTTADSGAGSLRQAITDANTNAGADTIVFAIGSGAQTINLVGGLPFLSGGGTTIDGTTQPGYVAGGAPLIYLSGSGVTLPGLALSSANNTVRGIGIVNFTFSTEGALLISGAGATGNVVTGSWIGVNANGTPAGNGTFGIKIDQGASNNRIGGTTAAERNLIAAFNNQGIELAGLSASQVTTGNRITGNYIGVNAAGTAAVGGLGPFAEAGVRFSGWAWGNLLGTDGDGSNDATEGNLIGGITRASGPDCIVGRGVQFISSGTLESPRNNIVAGNRIGVNANDSGTIPNNCGILIARGTLNTIGGDTAVEANIISGNTRYGIRIENAGATQNIVRGNRIGLDGAGNPRGNTFEGVFIRGGAPSNIIGPDNVIAGNGLSAVRITSNDTNGNIVRGNRLNTDPLGISVSPALYPSLQPTVRVDGGIGTVIENNQIGANLSNRVGILLQTSTTTATEQHTIRNNEIGIRGTAQMAAPEAGARGLVIDGTRNITITNNLIGAQEIGAVVINTGATAAAVDPSGLTFRLNSFGVGPCNDTAGNAQDGLFVQRAAAGNTIGAVGAGNSFYCNNTNGLRIGNQASGQIVAGNLAFGNDGAGYLVDTATAVQITRSTSQNNGGDGISLINGGNTNLAAPSALAFSTASGTPTLSGTIPNCSGCTIEVFTAADRDNGEGPVYLTAVTGVTGTSFSIAVGGCGRYLTATVRDGSGNTSRFATTMVDTGLVGGCSAAGLALSVVRIAPPGSGPVAPGTAVTYRYTLTNTGGLPVNGVVISITGGQGWNSAPTPPGPFNIAGGASVTFDIVVTVPPGANGGAADSFTVGASAGALTASVVTGTGAAQGFGVDLTPETGAQSFGSGPTTVTFNHTLANTGNGTDTIGITASVSPAATVNVNPTSCTLARGLTCPVVITLNVPASPAPSYVITVRATSGGDASVFDEVTDTATGQAAAPAIAPDTIVRDVLPGDSTIFNHTVTNAGNQAGTFTASRVDQLPLGGVVFGGPSPTSFSLAVGGTTPLALTATVPALPAAPISGTLVSTRVTVTSNDGISASATDTVRVLLRPAFTFGAATTPVSIAPLGTAVFTHTLTNESNGDDRYTLVVDPSARLEAVTVVVRDGGTIVSTSTIPVGGTLAQRSVTVAVPRATSRTISVSGRVQAGTLTSEPQQIVLSAQTQSSPQPAVQTRTDDITILGAVVADLSAATSATLTPGNQLSYTRSVTNAGNQAGDIVLSYTAPAGWSASTGTLTPSGCLVGLAPGATCQFAVLVDAAPRALAGAYRLVIDADAIGSAGDDRETDTISVAAAAAILFAPDRAAASAPDTQVSYTHTVTNSGNVTATLALDLTSIPAGWSAQIAPLAGAPLLPGATRAVTVTVGVPALLPAGTSGAVQARATLVGFPSASALVTDTTTVLAADRARLDPPAQSRSIAPSIAFGDSTGYALTLLNSGNTTISYTLELDLATLAPGWSAVLSPTLTEVRVPSLSSGVPISLTVAADAGVTGEQVVRVLARRAGVASAPVLATATITTTASASPFDLLLPTTNNGTALPGATVVYTHTLRNLRPVTDSFVLTVIAPFGYETLVAPSIATLGPGQSQIVSVSIQVPLGVEAGTLDVTTLTATSVSDPVRFTASAQERTRVLRATDATLAPRQAIVGAPGQVVEFRMALQNLSNARDIFTISASSEPPWDLRLPITSTTLEVDDSNTFIRVFVTIPASVPPGSIGRITVSAQSQSTPTFRASVTHVITIPEARAVIVRRALYLPVVGR